MTLGRSLASLCLSSPMSPGALWSSGENVTDSGHNDSYRYEKVTQPSLSPLPPAHLDPHTSLPLQPLTLSLSFPEEADTRQAQKKGCQGPEKADGGAGGAPVSPG